MTHAPLDPEEDLGTPTSPHEALPWVPLPPGSVRWESDGVERQDRRALDYLHRHWALPDSHDAPHASTGFRAKVVARFGRLTFRVLDRYMSEERDLLAHIVQVNESLEQRCNELMLCCRQLSEDMVNRQVAEARNQAELALWLHRRRQATMGCDEEDGPQRARDTPGQSSTTRT